MAGGARRWAGGRYIGRRRGACHSPRLTARKRACYVQLKDLQEPVSSSAMCVRARASVCACALLLALVLAEHDKRAEMSPMPFLMATRYGRSSPPARHLAPRNDRFFMSTRYGKRSEGALGAGGGEGAAVRGSGGALLCEFTGVFPLYRCRHKPPAYRKRSAEQTREEE